MPADIAPMRVAISQTSSSHSDSSRFIQLAADRVAEWLVDSRAHRVICLVAGIWVLNAFDLTLTLLAHSHGLLQEQNPVARQFLRAGPLSITLYKVGLVVIGSYPFIRFRKARITELGAFVVLIAYATLAMHWSDCYQLYSQSTTHDYSVADHSGTSRSPLP